ncbi:zinc ABC transporter substrate-binding protein [Brachybacterium sp. EF45031]|uniref:metal ABC transporter substrate-binding protein n=1 Tax=Brachybacterium sillae TaxID=2810536 RepID=UPI00217DBAF2|nr:metal ABC transporter substrate-binding protein [Brachybacterium sillae]MCS6710753.1 zinc ABC transporter substrate-binding protein [Brachybacterium sillae]
MHFSRLTDVRPSPTRGASVGPDRSPRLARPAAEAIPPRGISRRALVSTGLIGGGALALSACGSTGAGAGAGGRPQVITGTYALTYLVQAIGGDAVEVIDLAAGGGDPHGLELSMAKVAQVTEAALVTVIPGYQPALDDALTRRTEGPVLDVSQVVELLPASAAEEHDHGDHAHGEESAASDAGGDPSDDDHADHDHEEAEDHTEKTADEHAGEAHTEGDGHDHGSTDPHFWHDPQRMATLAGALGEQLASVAPQAAAAIRERTDRVVADLTALDEELTGTFSEVAGPKPFVTSHAAFTYLAERYGLDQIGISGIDPETEPSPQRLLELERTITEENVTTVFFEATASPKVATTLAERVGVTTAQLDNLETQQSPEADYPAVMRSNAAALTQSWA